MRQKSVQDAMIGISRGTVQMNLSPIETQELEIIVPDENVLIKTEEVLNPFYKKMITNYQKIQSLAKARDELLPKLMSGEVRVRF